ncbi:ATP-binding protein [Ancylobacter mangrovi]|uniref:ATP-binding protein n=1 Tax=Ancylobacter mangrovi TaxID=2972472 RepID=UPI0021616F82|nr:ATP-binding protein [Ancylobacter mangrovi]MCS0505151.1 ATP-binding protein [Ancylobacter mangrovi]
MEVVYLGRSGRRQKPSPLREGNVIELLDNNWDDYGRKTLFETTARIDGREVDLGSIKLLIEGVGTTMTRLSELRKGGWDGVFPIPGVNYISVPAEIEFYAQIISLLGEERATNVARALRDASFLVRIDRDQAAAALAASEDFRVSLQRERGAVKAYLDGWQLFANGKVTVASTRFRFTDAMGEESILALNFQSEGPLPHDINVLIGPNGVGKSQLLRQMVRAWLGTRGPEPAPAFEEPPNISQLVVVSYSPLEAFPVDTMEAVIADRDVYRYFGFRGRSAAPPEDEDYDEFSFDKPPPPPIFDTRFPRIQAAGSLVDALGDDQRYGSISDWPGKLRTMYEVLLTALDFDYLAVAVRSDGTGDGSLAPAGLTTIRIGDILYLPIRHADVANADVGAIRAALLADEGVSFIKNGVKLRLSSGQSLFSYVVINVLGAIRRNSLIVVDEPELFLHPTLEIQFIDMLKGILASLTSKALMATHSEVVVRETPRDCVHVFQRTDDGIRIDTPPFQTFAGDIQRISSYVFGDRTAAKPYEAWIREQLSQYPSADALLAALGTDVNEELVIRIRAVAAGRA